MGPPTGKKNFLEEIKKDTTEKATFALGLKK